MKNIHEILDEVALRKTKQEKIAVLQHNQGWALKNILQGAFDPRIQFTVKDIPKYNRMIAPIGMGWSSIHQELGRAYLFEANNPKTPPTLTEKRKNEILVQILENLEEKEAELFAGMIKKDLKVKGLTYDVVKEAFPELLP